MRIKSIKTKKFLPPKDELLPEIFAKIKKIPGNSILAITSKVVSIDQGRCLPMKDAKDRDALIKKEADYYLPRKFTPGGFVMHTIKQGLMIPSAGIDASNSCDYYVLWPRLIKKIISHYYESIKKHYQLSNFGLIITDSHSIPLRRGVLGISLSYIGFNPLHDYRGEADIFGRSLLTSQTNIADAIAAAATVVMGEGSEQTPLAIITDIPFVHFNGKIKFKKHYSSFNVPIKQDIYKPFFSAVKWRKGGK